MKKEISFHELQLLIRTIITLAIIFFFIAIGDFFFSHKKILFYPTLVLLIYSSFMIINIKNTYINKLKFVEMILLIIYFSFLCHYFFLDLLFVAVFSLLFLYTFLLFKGLKKTVLISLIILSITVLLYLFREHNNFLRSSGDSLVYLGYLRATSLLTIGVLLYFVLDFWLKSNRKDFESNPTVESPSAEYGELLESIDRKDNSFMPIFLDTHSVFVNKINKLFPRLTETELEVCALIKLGLNTKEIAIATNSTYKAIESAKYRLRKKMNLDSNTNLMLFFNNL